MTRCTNRAFSFIHLLYSQPENTVMRNNVPDMNQCKIEKRLFKLSTPQSIFPHKGDITDLQDNL